MAMTKAEKAALEALYERAALSWPPPPPKPIDLLVVRAATGSEMVRGWLFNLSGRWVREGVSLRGLHYSGPITDEQVEHRHARGNRFTFSQGDGGPWYATKLDAMRALHHALASEYARDLARVQRVIEAEEALSQASGEAA